MRALIYLLTSKLQNSRCRIAQLALFRLISVFLSTTTTTAAAANFIPQSKRVYHEFQMNFILFLNFSFLVANPLKKKQFSFSSSSRISKSADNWTHIYTSNIIQYVCVPAACISLSCCFLFQNAVRKSTETTTTAAEIILAKIEISFQDKICTCRVVYAIINFIYVFRRIMNLYGKCSIKCISCIFSTCDVFEKSENVCKHTNLQRMWMQMQMK